MIIEFDIGHLTATLTRRLYYYRMLPSKTVRNDTYNYGSVERSTNDVVLVAGAGCILIQKRISSLHKY